MSNLWRSVAVVVVLGVASVGWAPPAAAHISLKAPAPRDPDNPLKDPPCGRAGGTPRGESLTVFAPGERIMVMWEETIQHPGHYRIAFDSDGEDFPMPESFEDFEMDGADMGNGVIILADSIPDVEGGLFSSTPYAAELTLPDVECENCTIQVIQMMTDKAPYGNGDDIYFECANIALRRVGAGEAGSAGDAGAGGAPATGMAGAAAPSGAAGAMTAGSGDEGSAGEPAEEASAGASGSSGGAGSSSVPSSGGAVTAVPAGVAGAAPSAGGAAGAPSSVGQPVSAMPAASPVASDGGGCAVLSSAGQSRSAMAGRFMPLLALLLFALRRRRGVV